MLAWLAPYQLRLVFRGAFSLLALATVAMALYVLWQEKELSYYDYQHSFQKTAAEVAAKLRHPAGQLALLNPPRAGTPVTPLHPLLLPFSAIDFDAHDKVQQAVEMSGCQVQYKAGTVCVAVGNNPWAGGFIYVAGSFSSSELVAHPPGKDAILDAHHVRLVVNLRGKTYRWIAPFEIMGSSDNGVHGRLTGFVDNGDYDSPRRPIKDFRGWIWQSPDCLSAGEDGPHCLKRAFFPCACRWSCCTRTYCRPTTRYGPQPTSTRFRYMCG